MSWAGAVNQEKYYDASEVEEYIESVTATIKKLQSDVRDQARRADQAEQQLRHVRSEAPSGLRAFPALGESAGGAVADAEARARELIRDAERRSSQLLEGAHTEYERLIEFAERAALERSRQRELRLLAAVNIVVQRSHQLRDDLHLIEKEAVQWRLDLAQSTARPAAAPARGPVPATSEGIAVGWSALGYDAAPPARSVAPAPEAGTTPGLIPSSTGWPSRKQSPLA